MNSLPLLIGGAVGLVSLVIASALAYRRFTRLRTSFVSGTQKAEQELIEDIEGIGFQELQQTTSGRKLLIIYGQYKAAQLLTEGKESKAIVILNELLNFMREQEEKDAIKAELVVVEKRRHPLTKELYDLEQRLRNLEATISLLNEKMANPMLSPADKYKLRREIEENQKYMESVQKTIMVEKG